MKNVLFHPINQRQIDSLVKDLPQALLLSGPAGFGLINIAIHIAAKLGINPDYIYPEKDEVVDKTKGTISVEMIRGLYNSSSSKGANKIIIITPTDKMTTQAQNAFLKLLEEPNDNIHFMLITSDTSKILPTILSRVIELNIQRLTNSQTEEILDNLNVTDAHKRTQLSYIANGLPQELEKLAKDKEYFQKKSEIIRDARELLTGNNYSKLKIAQKYKDDRPETLALIDSALNILDKTISSNPKNETFALIESFLSIRGKIEQNGNIRLNITKLAI